MLPPEFFIYETYRLNYKWYHDDGKNTALEIVTLFSKHFDIAAPGTKILDWGCGPGRIVRHFPELLPAAKIFGTDYNSDYIQWCGRNLKGIEFSLNRKDPPTIYPDNFFDAITGLSIFTHLSENAHYGWIDELHRIVKPGGYMFITTQGRAYYSRLTTDEKKIFESGNLVTRKYVDEGNRLYSSFQPIEFMNKFFGAKFRVVESLPGELANGEPAQDSWLLKKI